jgi:hypothetical protein
VVAVAGTKMGWVMVGVTAMGIVIHRISNISSVMGMEMGVVI